MCLTKPSVGIVVPCITVINLTKSCRLRLAECKKHFAKSKNTVDTLLAYTYLQPHSQNAVWSMLLLHLDDRAPYVVALLTSWDDRCIVSACNPSSCQDNINVAFKSVLNGWHSDAGFFARIWPSQQSTGSNLTAKCVIIATVGDDGWAGKRGTGRNRDRMRRGGGTDVCFRDIWGKLWTDLPKRFYTGLAQAGQTYKKD